MTEEQLKTIDDLVIHYRANQNRFFVPFVEQLRNILGNSLSPFVHSMRWRVKDAEHLRIKLTKKFELAEKNGGSFDYTKDNLFHKINDLAGFRIIHLHTQQFAELNKRLLETLDEHKITLIEGPIANTWDDESKNYFNAIGVQTKDNPRMYTSVHYVVEANQKTKITGEIQVRTLADELWGEVDHKINYPNPSKSPSCRDQIKVLARFTSGCSRLVDSIFLSDEESKN